MMRKLRTPQDIENFPGYVIKVDPLLNPLRRIVEPYYIHPFSIKCGLTGCGQTHMDGFIVELADSKITNIGHVCGKRFGEKFDQERTKNYENEYKPRLIQAVTQAQSRMIEDQFKLQEIRHRTNDKARLAADFTKMFPDLVETLRRRAFSNSADVFEMEERRKDEIDDLMAANRFQSREALAFKERLVGTVSGFRFPVHDWSMSSGLRKLFNDVEKFGDVKPRSLPMVDLQRWAHWAEDFDDNLTRTMNGIEDGDKFFCTANFQLFATLSPSDAIKVRLLSLQLKDVSSASADQPASHARPPSITKKRPARNISAKQLRRITGDKKAR